MDVRHEAFINASPLFYDVLHAAPTDQKPFGLATRELPEGWGRSEQSDWMVMSPSVESELPAQGWKIHASSCLDNAERVIDTVWSYCEPRNIKFKFMRSYAALMGRVTKYAARGYSGKLVTIYPTDEAACERILIELGELLDGEPNPYILSDLRWGNGPLFVRYGAFSQRFCVLPNGQIAGAIEDDTGTLVPDRRGPVFYVPPWIQLPAFLQPHLDKRNSVTLEGLPYTVESAIHFSNGGGIYLATRDDGVKVVLKEARPHAGIDANRDDAVRRLEREYDLLTRFAGIPGVPEVYDIFDVGEHRFVAMEYIDGRPLSKEVVRRFPIIKRDATPEDFAEYTEWALDIHAQVHQAIDAIHEHGYVYGDLHMWNVVVRDDGRIGLLDFEVAAPVTDNIRPGLGNQGFAAPRGTTGFDLDRYALACLRLALFLPVMNMVWIHRPKARHLAGIIAERFPVPAEFLAEAVEVITPGSTPPPRLEASWPDSREQLVKAIIASGTPARDDRLFPGDPQQFGIAGGLGLAYGAAGVLYALHAAGVGPFPEYEQWLLKRALNLVPGTPLGLYDGLHGVAFTLDILGYSEEALKVLEICLRESWTTLGLELTSGLAGIGINLLNLADRLGEPGLREHGLKAAHLVAERLGDESTVGEVSGGQNPYAGLFRGASGPALLLMRAYDETGDSALLDKAATALRMDLKRCVVRDEGTMHVNEQWRTMPYLETGSIGIGFAIDEYLTRGDDEQFRTASAQISLAAESDLYVLPGLFQGRAGILTYLAQRRDPRMDKQIRHLDWHALPYEGGISFPGMTLLRMSMDFATGTAGVLFALAAAAQETPIGLPHQPVRVSETIS